MEGWLSGLKQLFAKEPCGSQVRTIGSNPIPSSTSLCLMAMKIATDSLLMMAHIVQPGHWLVITTAQCSRDGEGKSLDNHAKRRRQLAGCKSQPRPVPSKVWELMYG